MPVEAAADYKPVENKTQAASAQREPLFAPAVDSGPAIYQTTAPGPAKHPSQRNSRMVKRRWSLVRMAVKQIGVLNAFRAMKTYRTVHGIEV